MENEAGEEKQQGQMSVSRPFHQRFNIEVNLGEAQQRFMNRVMNALEDQFPGLNIGVLQLSNDEEIIDLCEEILRSVADTLGLRYSESAGLTHYVTGDFARFLQCLEAVYEVLVGRRATVTRARHLDTVIKETLSVSEFDLGIEWKDGVFLKSGAKLLDEELVNEPLQWLSDDPKYKNVLAPFKKGLSHYLEASKAPERLSDVVTDMYEALEAMAKIVTEKPTGNLHDNAERFVKKLGLSEYYSKNLRESLKGYTDYANKFRHGQEQGKERVQPTPQEVEAFVYTTGIYLRLAIERMKAQQAPG